MVTTEDLIKIYFLIDKTIPEEKIPENKSSEIITAKNELIEIIKQFNNVEYSDSRVTLLKRVLDIYHQIISQD